MAIEGRESVVKLLLAWEDINMNLPNNRENTPLFLAVQGGHRSMVRLLLTRDDVDVNRSL
jgi:ankyrin repeat protein